MWNGLVVFSLGGGRGGGGFYEIFILLFFFSDVILSFPLCVFRAVTFSIPRVLKCNEY